MNGRPGTGPRRFSAGACCGAGYCGNLFSSASGSAFTVDRPALGLTDRPPMLEPWVAVTVTMAWLLGVAVALWLVWRAARKDQVEQERAEAAETPKDPVS